MHTKSHLHLLHTCTGLKSPRATSTSPKNSPARRLSQKISKSPPPSIITTKPQERASITPSFRSPHKSSFTSGDISLDSILSDKDGLDTFTQHLEREFSLENIQFYKDVTAFISLASPSGNEIKEKAKSIYELYIVEGSPKQVNISSRVRLNIESSFKDGDISVRIFDKALEEIKLLMSADTLARYRKSDLYTQYQRLKSGSSSPFLTSASPVTKENKASPILNAMKAIFVSNTFSSGSSSPDKRHSSTSRINFGTSLISTAFARSHSEGEKDRKNSADSGDISIYIL
jgi:hypothetical protein